MITPWEGSTRTPRKWQAEAYPVVMASLRAGRPSMVYACTGSGKSVLVAEVCRTVALTAGPEWRVVVTTSRQSLVRQLTATIGERLGRDMVGPWYGRSKKGGRVTVACNDSLGTLAEHHDMHGHRTALLICDEAHRITTGDQWGAIEAIAPRTRLAVTATPYHADHDKALGGWDAPCVEYRVSQAVADGVLVPAVPYGWTGDAESGVDEACLAMLRRHQPTGPGIISADDIADAEAYAERLTVEWAPVLAYHSRLRPKEQRRRLAALESGEVRALVHPSILTEGVDLPWLMWGCLRAKRNRRDLVQEVGRLVRSYPGKAEAMVLDPLRQVLGTGLDHDAHVVQSLEDALVDELEREAREAAEREEEELQRVQRLAVSVGEASSWVERLAVRVRAAGWIEDAAPVGSWRDRAPSAKQREALGRMSRSTTWLPDDAREPVRLLLDRPDMLTAGAASDLVTVLSAVRRKVAALATEGGGKPDWKDARRRWKWDRDAVPIEEVTW